MSEPVNAFDVALRVDDDGEPDGYRGVAYARLGPVLGATHLGASVYELPAGASICPYHYEYGAEEWLLVLAGRPTLRTPAGERKLEPGDVACFPEGPAGAHKVTNRGAAAARVVMLSTKGDPAIAVYPDSDKVGIFGVGDDELIARRSSAVEYWDGELAGAD